MITIYLLCVWLYVSVLQYFLLGHFTLILYYCVPYLQITVLEFAPNETVRYVVHLFA